MQHAMASTIVDQIQIERAFSIVDENKGRGRLAGHPRYALRQIVRKRAENGIVLKRKLCRQWPYMPHASPLSLKFADQTFAILISLDYDGNVEISHGADMTLMFHHASIMPCSMPFQSPI